MTGLNYISYGYKKSSDVYLSFLAYIKAFFKMEQICEAVFS